MSRVKRLSIVLALNLVLVATLVIVGINAHSLAVFAEGGDYLADGAAVGVSLLAIWLTHRPATVKRPTGYPRASTIAAAVNGGWLLVLNLLVALAASWRLLTRTPHVEGLAVLMVSGLAAVSMLVGAVILRADDEAQDLNMRAVFLDTAADAVAAGGVAASGAVIFATGRWNWLDPLLALVIALVVGYHTIGLLRDVAIALRA